MERSVAGVELVASVQIVVEVKISLSGCERGCNQNKEGDGAEELHGGSTVRGSDA